MSMENLVNAAKKNRRISSLVAELPERYTHSDRIKDFPTAQSRELLARLSTDAGKQRALSGKSAAPVDVNTTDGARLTFADGDIVHLRASGNAPGLRCYAESARLDTAKALCVSTLGRVR